MKNDQPQHHVHRLAARLELLAQNTVQRAELGDNIEMAGTMSIAAAELRRLHLELETSLTRAVRPLGLERDDDEDEGAAPPPPEASGSRCRHEWDAPPPGTQPACVKCGKLRSNQGRRSSATPPQPALATVGGVTKIDPPSQGLPLPEKGGAR